MSGFATTVRRPSPAELFRRADRLRREGRDPEAAALVSEGLRRSPRSAAGHLLAAYIHFASREIARAREAFEQVRALDPDHPRALLGLARLALEEGHPEAAGPYLRRALQYHADFPEARALEEMVANWSAPAGAAANSAAPSPASGGLRLLPGGRDAILVRTDGSIVLAHCDEARQSMVSEHVTRIARMAAATLARAGLGPLRCGVIAGAREATYLQADAGHVLSVTLPEATAIGAGLGEVSRLWTEQMRPGAIGLG